MDKIEKSEAIIDERETTPTRLCRPREKPRSWRGRGLEFRGSNSTKRVSVVRPFYGAFLVGRLTLISASMLRHTASRRRVRPLWPVQ
jgi:hypothetical protein